MQYTRGGVIGVHVQNALEERCCATAASSAWVQRDPNDTWHTVQANADTQTLHHVQAATGVSLAKKEVSRAPGRTVSGSQEPWVKKVLY